MTGKKQDDQVKQQSPDEISRELWHHWRIFLIVIVLLVVARIALPHIPLLRGWEQKFSGAAIELGKEDIPADALQVGTLAGVKPVFDKVESLPQGFLELSGPVLVAAWRCAPLGESGSCLRFIHRGEPLTMVITTHTKRFSKTNGPFNRTGWGGYFIVQKNLAAALVGPFDPRDILSVWPYAVKFANSAH